MGRDVRVRQSDQWRGRCKLTKHGDPEVRRLLFNAAMQGRRNPLWEPYYLSLRGRGMSTTAAFVALGRNLARVCCVGPRSPEWHTRAPPGTRDAPNNLASKASLRRVMCSW